MSFVYITFKFPEYSSLQASFTSGKLPGFLASPLLIRTLELGPLSILWLDLDIGLHA
jgi:hypothetical protein